MKCAVIYYSKSGTTERIAERVREEFDADAYCVEPEREYGSYLSAVVRVVGEKLTRRRPGVRGEVADLSGYDTVFVGFPVWYGTLPSFLQDYLAEADLSGKRVIPFATAGANGRESSLRAVRELLPGSDVTDYFYTSATSKGDPDAWLRSIEAR